MNEIMQRITDRYYEPNVKFTNPKTYDDNYVFDENKSVKWNRDTVKRKNRESFNEVS